MFKQLITEKDAVKLCNKIREDKELQVLTVGLDTYINEKINSVQKTWKKANHCNHTFKNGFPLCTCDKCGIAQEHAYVDRSDEEVAFIISIL